MDDEVLLSDTELMSHVRKLAALRGTLRQLSWIIRNPIKAIKDESWADFEKTLLIEQIPEVISDQRNEIETKALELESEIRKSLFSAQHFLDWFLFGIAHTPAALKLFEAHIAKAKASLENLRICADQAKQAAKSWAE